MFLYAFSDHFTGCDYKQVNWGKVKDLETIRDISSGGNKKCDIFKVKNGKKYHHLINVPFLSVGVSEVEIATLGSIIKEIRKPMNDTGEASFSSLKESLSHLV